MSIAQQYGDYISKVKFSQIPVEVQDYAKTLLLNQLGLSLASHSSSIADAFSNLATQSENSNRFKHATTLHGKHAVSPQDAAFANGALFHIRVQDDTHSTAHLGTSVIAAALAAVESRGHEGEDLLSALIAGYEVGTAINDACGALLPPRAFRTTGVVGTIAAAAAAARAFRLNAEQSAHALAIATSLAGGLTESFGAGSSDYVIQSGAAARNGIVAAQLAEQGITGSLNAFESSSGFLSAFAGDASLALKLHEPLGTHYRSLSIMMKALPLCAGNQTPFANAKRLRERIGSDTQLKSIEIHMHPFEASYPGIDYSGPFSTRLQTLMSTKFGTALALLGRPGSLYDLEDYADQQVLELIERSRIIKNDGLKMLESFIRVETATGTIEENHLVLPKEYWHPGFNEVTQRLASLGAELACTQAHLMSTANVINTLNTAPDIDSLIGHVSVVASATREAAPLNLQ